MGIKKIITVCLFTALFLICGCKGQSNYDKAVMYQKDAEYEKAIQFYNMAIEKGENVAVCEKNLGDIFFGDKNYDDAFGHYQNSMNIDPSVALDTMVKFISFNDSYVRYIVGYIFSTIDNEQAQNLINSSLSEILRSDDKYKILDTLDVIIKMKDRVRPISGDIIGLLGTDSVMNQKVLEILPNIADIVPETEGFNKLLEFLNQKDEIMKEKTIECLGNMHEHAISLLPNLLDLAVKEPRYKEQILSAVDKMGLPTRDQMEQMYSFLQDKPKDIKIHMLDCFGNFGEGANGYVPYITYFLNDSDNDIKQVTRNTLTKIGKAAQDTVPELIKLLQENNDEIVARAIYELGDIGSSAVDAIEPLKKVVETSKNKDNIKLANDAIKKIQ